MKTQSLYLTLAALAVGCSGAIAQEEGAAKKPDRPEGAPPAGGRPEGGPGGAGGLAALLKPLDTDNNGTITQAEAGERWERLARLDKNGDGSITKDEIPAIGGGGGAPGSPGTPGAPGQGNRPGGAQMFETADKNSDGKLTEDEVPAEAWARISQADKNGDKGVSREELMELGRGMIGGAKGGMPGAPGAGEGAGRFFQAADKNGDGKITADEAGERWENLSKLDKNGDGGVSRDELPAIGQGAPGMPGGPQGGPMGRPGQAGGGGGVGAIFGQSDKNSDGKLSQDEVPAEMWSKLSQADKNADGFVSREELTAVYAERPGAEKGGDRPRPEGAKKAAPAQP